MNMGSYNYLGFAEKTGLCADESEAATRKYGIGICSFRQELGKHIVRCHLLNQTAAG